MNELITIEMQEIGGGSLQTVNARDLHAFLESKQQFADWIKARIKKYGFAEGVDYVSIHKIMNGAPSTDFHISIDMAKELAMVERNAKGKEARLYFIECERVSKQVPILASIPTHAEALRLAADLVEKNEALQHRIEADRPKVELATAISESESLISFSDYAKLISNQEGFVIGENNLFALCRAIKLIDYRNMPYQQYLDLGWFKVIERTWKHEASNGPRPYKRTMISGIGQVSILAKIKRSGRLGEFLNKSARANRAFTTNCIPAAC